MAFDQLVASKYEAWYDTPEGMRADVSEKAALGRLLKCFPEAGSVLEVGCGTAHFTRWLSAQGMSAVGLDLSEAMLTQARALGCAPLVQGNALRLPFVDGVFGLVVLVTTLEFLERPCDALVEALRVARHGLLLGVLNRWSLLALQRRLARLVRRTNYDTARFYGVRELRRMLESVSVRTASISWRTTLYPRWWLLPRAYLPWGGFVAMALIAQDELEGEA